MPIKGRNGDVLNKIAESFRPFAREIWKDLNFGLCRSKVEFEKFRSSTNLKNELADQFTLVLPYAGSVLRWEVLFDSACPWLAPDFRFDDEAFLSQADASVLEANVPSLAAWDESDPGALSHVLTQLMSLYRKHQKSLLGADENSRAFFEYSALVGESDTAETDIEVLVGPWEAVSFLIKLNIDCSPLPGLFADDLYDNPGGECAVLVVKYPNPSVAELLMSPLVTRAAGDVALPPIHQSAVLMDYVPMVTNLINKKIALIAQNEKLRHQLLSHFIVKYEGSVLEHDSTSASFLLEVNHFYCILLIQIGASFPERAPTLTLRSIYHKQEDRPFTKVLTACPYDKIEPYITQQIEIFKQESTYNNAVVPSDQLKVDLL